MTEIEITTGELLTAFEVAQEEKKRILEDLKQQLKKGEGEH